MSVPFVPFCHSGTLDPLATGVMLVCTGRATKEIDTLQAGVKEYVATMALGATTPSFDLETEIDATYPTGIRVRVRCRGPALLYRCLLSRAL